MRQQQSATSGAGPGYQVRPNYPDTIVQQRVTISWRGLRGTLISIVGFGFEAPTDSIYRRSENLTINDSLCMLQTIESA